MSTSPSTSSTPPTPDAATVPATTHAAPVITMPKPIQSGPPASAPPKAAAPAALSVAAVSIGVDHPAALEVMRAAHDCQVRIGAMADMKASFLLVSSLIVLAIVGPHAVQNLKEYGLMALAVTSIIVVIFALKTLRPRLLTLRQRNLQPELNLLFCGHFAHMTESDYLTRLRKEFATPASALDTLAKDVFQMGIILHKKKLPCLNHTCIVLYYGLLLSAIATVVAHSQWVLDLWNKRGL